MSAATGTVRHDQTAQQPRSRSDEIDVEAAYRSHADQSNDRDHQQDGEHDARRR